MTAPPPGPLPERRADATDRLLALGLVGLGLVTRLPFLEADQGWFDEIFTLYTAGLSLPEVVRGALTEQTNPPGYYLLAHVWGLLGGGGLAWHRLFVALCGAVAPALLLLAARRLALSRGTAVVAGILGVTAPFLWQMSLEVRAYAPLALLSAVALWLAAGLAMQDAAPTRRQLLGLAGVHVAMVVLHYFGAFSVFGTSVAVAVAARLRREASVSASLRMALVLGGPAALTIAAWLTLAFVVSTGLGGRNVAWIPDTAALDALRQVPALVLADLGSYGRPLSFALLLGGIGTCVAWVRSRGAAQGARRAAGSVVLLAAVLPVLLAVALQAFGGRNIWVLRYLTGFVPALALLAAAGLDALPASRRRVATIGVACWWSVAGVLTFLNRPAKPDWTQLIAALAPSGRATICANGSFVGLPFLYYARSTGAAGLRIVNPALCTPDDGLTWLVYSVEADGSPSPPAVTGLTLGPRIVLSRGLQNLDARRVLAIVPPP